MPLDAQAKLLRVLQSREVFPLGATQAEPVDVRVVCATHRNLKELRGSGKFREDLYARLNEFQIDLPPLRDRKEDIFSLASAFLTRHGAPHLVPSFAYMAALIHYDWPHNVRELEACIKRAAVLCADSVLNEDHLPPELHDAMLDYGRCLATLQTQAAASTPDAPRGTPTESALKELLELHRGNVSAVARDLGKARAQVHRYLKRYGLSVDAFRR